MKNNVGRPIEKIGRTKIGLSIDGITSNLLDDLSKKLGKTKSKIVEEAILNYYEKNKELDYQLDLLNKNKDEPYLQIKEMLYNSFKNNT